MLSTPDPNGEYVVEIYLNIPAVHAKDPGNWSALVAQVATTLPGLVYHQPIDVDLQQTPVRSGQ
jgi:hypothetical protein